MLGVSMPLPDKPLVSCLIPAYNHQEYIGACIRSIISQSYANIELIIVNDGSTDKTDEAIKEMSLLCHERFTRFIYTITPNRGVSAALNTCLELSKGQYIKTLASDDMLLRDDAIEIYVDAAEEFPECDMVSADSEYMDEHGRKLFISKEGIWSIAPDKSTMDTFFSFVRSVRLDMQGDINYEDIYELLLVANFLPAPGFFYKRGLFTEVGGFDKTILHEDWDFLLRASLRHKIKILETPLVRYRFHPENTLKTTPMTELLHSVLVIFRKQRTAASKRGYAKVLAENVRKHLKLLPRDILFDHFFFCLRGGFLRQWFSVYFF